MRSLILICALFANACALAYYPSHGFYYVQGVNQGTFSFDLPPMAHVYNYHSDMWLAGEDLCLMSEAAFARYANARNGGLYSSRNVVRTINTNQFNRVIACICGSLKNNDNNYCWIKYNLYDSTVSPSSLDDKACAFLKSCGFTFHESYSSLSGISENDNLVLKNGIISRDKARRVFGALYNQKMCIIEPSGWGLGGSYSFEKTVDDRGTPSSATYLSPVAPFYSGRIAYYNSANITAVRRLETGIDYLSRWHIKQEVDIPDFCSYRSQSCSVSRSSTTWRIYRAVRRKRNWSTGAVTTKTGYYLTSNESFDKSFISDLGIQDDVNCPSVDSALLLKILESAPPAQRDHYGWDDYLVIECVSSFILSTMNGDYYWNSEWSY